MLITKHMISNILETGEKKICGWHGLRHRVEKDGRYVNK